MPELHNVRVVENWPVPVSGETALIFERVNGSTFEYEVFAPAKQGCISRKYSSKCAAVAHTVSFGGECLLWEDY